jgi:uncharacterized protein
LRFPDNACTRVFFKSCRGRIMLPGVIFLCVFLFAFIGCAVVNRFIFTPTKGITATPARSGIPFQEVWFRSADGVRLNGWFIGGGRSKPLVLYFHGVGGNLSDMLDYIKLLHNQGFPVFIFDYRGYGKSEGAPLRENDLYQDGRGAIAFLEGRGWQPERMIFFGQSLGSAVALQSALEFAPAGLVMEGSFTKFKDVMRHVSPLGYLMVGWWGVDLPFDNLAKIGKVTVPVLLIHGEKDQVAPVQMTMRLFEAAPSPKMLHIVRNGGHCNAFAMDSYAYLAAWNSYAMSLSVRTAAKPAPAVTP